MAIVLQSKVLDLGIKPEFTTNLNSKNPKNNVNKVVIVEDDFIIQLFLQSEIQKLDNCELMNCFDNGEDLLEFYNTTELFPDVLLMDVKLSGKLDGIQTVKLLQESHQVKIIFITGNTDQKSLDQMQELNPLHIIKKPLDEVSFGAHCKQIINRASAT